MITKIEGGICAPNGFVTGATACGIKEKGSDRLDLTVIYSEEPTVGSAVFTENRVKAAPVCLSRESIRTHAPRAIVANSGNANACTGEPGMEHARKMAETTAEVLGLESEEVQVCSTGIIGLKLPIDRIVEGIARAAGNLERNGEVAARAIMTSDTVPKEVAVEYRDEDGVTIRIGAIAKGAGMINPNMATMLCFVTTDYAISQDELDRATRQAVDQSFNRITVDGDMSTNDTVVVMANGQAGNEENRNLAAFEIALNGVMLDLAKKIVGDGERVTKLVTVKVVGAASDEDAGKVARAVCNSKLVKCSWNGNDPNWGRIIHAVGYAGAEIEENKIDISFDGVPACRGGLTADSPLAELAELVSKPEFGIEIDLNLGEGGYVMYSSDLSPEYVEFNREEYALTRRKLEK